MIRGMGYKIIVAFEWRMEKLNNERASAQAPLRRSVVEGVCVKWRWDVT